MRRRMPQMMKAELRKETIRGLSTNKRGLARKSCPEPARRNSRLLLQRVRCPVKGSISALGYRYEE